MEYIRLNCVGKVEVVGRDWSKTEKYVKGHEVRVFISHIVRYAPEKYTNRYWSKDGRYKDLRGRKSIKFGSVLVDKLGVKLSLWQSPEEIDKLIDKKNK